MSIFEKTGVKDTVVNGIVAGLVSLIATSLLYIVFENQRDRVQHTHDYILLFHSDAHSQYRDTLMRTWMKPQILRALNTSDQEFSRAVLAEANSNPGIYVAVYTMVTFLQDFRSCISAGVCLEGVEAEAFRTFADGFHGIYYPILREYDCRVPDQSSEAVVLSFLGKSVPEYNCDFYVDLTVAASGPPS
jgi:hypothetical protein